MSNEATKPRNPPTLDDSITSLNRLADTDSEAEVKLSEGGETETEQNTQQKPPTQTKDDNTTKSGFIAALAARRKSVFGGPNRDTAAIQAENDLKREQTAKAEENLPSLLTQQTDTNNDIPPATIKSSLWIIGVSAVVFLIPAIVILAFYHAGLKDLIAYGNRNNVPTDWTEFEIILETSRWLIALWLLGTLLPIARIFMMKILRPIVLLSARIPLLSKAAKEKMLAAHDTLLATENHIARIVGMIPFLSCLVILLPNSTTEDAYQRTILLVFAGLTVFTGLVAVEKIALQVLSVSFHSVAYTDRINAVDLQLRALRKLSVAIETRKTDSYRNLKKAKAALTTALDQFGKVVKPFQFKTRSESKTPRSGKTSGHASPIYISQPADSISLEESKKEEQSGKTRFATDSPRMNKKSEYKKAESMKFAEQLFDALSIDGLPIEASSFRPYFPSKAEAQAAFNLFDGDGNTTITRHELSAIVLHCNKEQIALGRSLRDMGSAIGKLDKLAMCLVVIISIILFIVIFSGSSSLNTLLSFGTSFLGLSFMFGNSAAALFDSCIFIFVVHAFDVGDIILASGVKYEVKEIALWSSRLQRFDGAEVYAPNQKLGQSFVVNLSRSKSMGEDIFIDVMFSVDDHMIKRFEDGLNHWLRHSSIRRVVASDRFQINVDTSSKTMSTLHMWLQHKGNFVKILDCLAVRNRVVGKFKELLSAEGVEICPAVRVLATPMPVAPQ